MYETIFEQVPIGIMVVDPTGSIRLVNAAAAAIFGYEPDELTGLEVERLMPVELRSDHPSHRASYAEAPVPRLMGADRPLAGLRKDGSEVPVQVGLFPAPNGPEIFVSVIDVSARESVRQALLEAQKINKTGTWSFDVDSERVVWSPELFRIFRLPETSGAPPYDTHHELFTAESWRRLEPAVTAAMEHGTPYEIELELSVTDEQGPLAAVARCEPQRDATGTVVRLVGTFQDVTELARARRQRDRLLERLSLARTAAKLAIWEWEIGEDRLVWDDAMYDLYGVEPGTPVAYADWRDAVHPDDREAAEAHARAALAGGGVFRRQFRIRGPGGERHILAAASVHEDAVTGARRMVGINMDVSEFALFQQMLRERNEQWDRFFEATSNMLWNWEFATDHVDRNEAFQSALGYSTEEVTPDLDWWVERLHPADRDRVMRTFEEALETGAETTGYTYRIRRRDGSYATVRDRVYLMRDERGHAYRALGAMTDITDQIRREEQAQRANNLESLGLLAGGIAHDFNNQLTSVLALAELVDLKADDPKRMHELADQLREAVELATQLTRQLLTFSKGGAPSRQTVALDELVQQHASFALTGSSTKVTFDFEEGLWPASVDPGQIAQVIQNLVINADQAMERGGELRIAARNLDHQAGARMIELRVTDSGPGIPRDAVQRIFDPYFSTKTKGHGLGLAICHSIVERHDGTIRAESPPGEGATFVIHLPASYETIREEVGAKGLTEGAARLLVVDDLPEVRRLLSGLLTALGYRVDTAEAVDDSAAAIAAALEADDPYAVVITDLTIPGTAGGLEVLKRAKALDPTVCVVVASGYANDPVLADHEAHGFDGKLTKPIGLRALSSVLASVLGTECAA